MGSSNPRKTIVFKFSCSACSAYKVWIHEFFIARAVSVWLFSFVSAISCSLLQPAVSPLFARQFTGQNQSSPCRNGRALLTYLPIQSSCCTHLVNSCSHSRSRWSYHLIGSLTIQCMTFKEEMEIVYDILSQKWSTTFHEITKNTCATLLVGYVPQEATIHCDPWPWVVAQLHFGILLRTLIEMC